MIKTFSPTDISDAFDGLSRDLSQVITETDVPTIVAEIGEKYHLHVDDQGVIYNEVMFVLVDLSPAQDFSNRVHDRLSLDTHLEDTIVSDVDQQIFQVIRGKLQDRFEKRGEEFLESYDSKEREEQTIEQSTNTELSGMGINITNDSNEQGIENVANKVPTPPYSNPVVRNLSQARVSKRKSITVPTPNVSYDSTSPAAKPSFSEYTGHDPYHEQLSPEDMLYS
ncbi:MAG: hypothetical protein OEX08_00340 [Candidatus Nomurabacteria bacterium]|nr:hypothetical protein [Candidatus Nomurabacteria bacterium]